MIVAALAVILLVWWGRTFLWPPDARDASAVNAAWDRMAERQRNQCEICSGRAVYLCPTCKAPISTHTHENDFICKTHGFVSPIRQADGARINGDGGCHDLSVTAQ